MIFIRLEQESCDSNQARDHFHHESACAAAIRLGQESCASLPELDSSNFRILPRPLVFYAHKKTARRRFINWRRTPPPTILLSIYTCVKPIYQFYSRLFSLGSSSPYEAPPEIFPCSRLVSGQALPPCKDPRPLLQGRSVSA